MVSKIRCYNTESNIANTKLYILNYTGIECQLKAILDEISERTANQTLHDTWRRYQMHQTKMHVKITQNT